MTSRAAASPIATSAAVAAGASASTAPTVSSSTAAASISAAIIARPTFVRRPSVETLATRSRRVALTQGGLGERVSNADRFTGQQSHVRRLNRALLSARRRVHLAALILHFLNFFFDRVDDMVEFLELLKEVGDVEESVAIEANVHKRRLHAGKHACDTAFIDAAN